MSFERKWLYTTISLLVLAVALMLVRAYGVKWSVFVGYEWVPNAIAVASILIGSIGSLMLGNWWSGYNERKSED